MKAFSLASLCRAVDGTLLAGDETTQIFSVTTDSREAVAGGLFIPIVGERFDGHDYIDSALAAGAQGCLCSHRPSELLPGKFYVLVADTRLAYQRLAAWYRGEFSAIVVQITGSVGKTTAKDMLASVLSQHGDTLWTEANFNNEIGIPRTLLRMEPTHWAAVIETGMDRMGELREDGEMVQPQVAVIMNAGEAHIERLGSLENIFRAKCEIFEHLTPDGTAIVNGDDARFDTLTIPQRVLRFGMGERCDVRVTDVVENGIESVSCIVRSAKGSYALTIPSPGRHMVYPAAMSVAVGELLGLTEEEIVRGIAAYTPSGARMRVLHLPQERVLLDDCYNANPQSMAAALHVLSTCAGRRVAVLGDMRELGAISETEHRRIGAAVAQLGIDELITVGPEAAYIAEAARAAGIPVTHCDDTEQAIPPARRAFTAGTSVLVKASHSLHFESISRALCE